MNIIDAYIYTFKYLVIVITGIPIIKLNQNIYATKLSEHLEIRLIDIRITEFDKQESSTIIENIITHCKKYKKIIISTFLNNINNLYELLQNHNILIDFVIYIDCSVKVLKNIGISKREIKYEDWQKEKQILIDFVRDKKTKIISFVNDNLSNNSYDKFWNKVMNNIKKNLDKYYYKN